MRYIDHGAGGGPDCMHIAEAPRPNPDAEQVLIEVWYAGVNRPDVIQRLGRYPPPPGASPIIGLEVAGQIVAVGAQVTKWQRGDFVCALTHGGGYAEYCVAHADHCLPIPNGLTCREAAGIPENFFTVWANVFVRGRLRAGERFLVHGGSSGIGLAAIQLAKSFGATVYTTVGSAAKSAACVERGADFAINYREQDFEKEVQQITDKRGVDVVLDMVGGQYMQKNLRILANEGRLVHIAFLEGSRDANLDLLPVMLKCLTITGSTLRPRTVAEKSTLANELRTQVWPLFESKKIKPVVYAEFPLAQAALAHELMESSRHIGKILLAVKPNA